MTQQDAKLLRDTAAALKKTQADYDAADHYAATSMLPSSACANRAEVALPAT